MHPLLQLMRLDKPIGIWLLFFPAAWAVTLAAPGAQLFSLLGIMLVGAVVTRSAGCILNDLADRRLDAAVARTRERPLASGRVSVAAAVALLVLLLTLALWLALQLPPRVFWLSLVALPMIAAYPWMKRLTWWPQLFLGLTFNLGVLFGWLATGRDLNVTAFALYAAGMCWTLGYDTIYAVQDMDDDARVGIKSTARRLGPALPRFVGLCYAAMMALLTFVVWHESAGFWAYIGVTLAGWHAARQWRQLPCSAPQAAQIFRSNQWLGCVVWLGLLLARAPLIDATMLK